MRFLLIAGAITLAGCSSTGQVADVPTGQYCYTDETMTEQNGSVDTKTVVSCSDKPKVNHLTRSAGVAKSCREYVQRIQINGRVKNVKGFLCEFPGGRWEPVNGVYAY